MKQKKTYHFRDNKNLLENIQKGERSKFIRDALELKFNIDDIAYKEKQATAYDMIKHYKKTIKHYDEELDTLKEETNNIKQKKKKAKLKLNRTIKEVEELNNQIKTKRKLLEDTNTTKHRNEAANTLIKNILIMKKDALANPVNIEYLKTHGNFKNNEEFKIYVQEYIIKNIKTGDIIANTMITLEDIEYITNEAKRLIK